MNSRWFSFAIYSNEVGPTSRQFGENSWFRCEYNKCQVGLLVPYFDRGHLFALLENNTKKAKDNTSASWGFPM